MHTIGFLSVSTVFLIAYHSEHVNCEGEEIWTYDPLDVGPDHSTEPSHNNEDWKHEDQVPTEHSLPQHDWSNEENGSSGMANSITEPSNSHGWSENPLQTESQASPIDRKNESQGFESSDSQNHDDGHQHPTPSGQWSTAGESQSWTDINDSHGNWSTDSGISRTTLSADTQDHDSELQNPTPSDQRGTAGDNQSWTDINDSHGNWSTDLGISRTTPSADTQDHDSELQNPTPSDQRGSAGDSQSWTDINDSHGNWSTDSGISRTTPSADTQDHDSELQNPTPSDQRGSAGDSQSWTDINDSHGNWSTDSGISRTTLSADTQDHDSELQNPTPSDQRGSAGDIQSWTDINDSHGNWSTDSGISRKTPSADTQDHDSELQNPTPSDQRGSAGDSQSWTDINDPHGNWSTDSGISRTTPSADTQDHDSELQNPTPSGQQSTAGDSQSWTNSITEPSNSHGWSENPLQNESQATPTDHQNESQGFTSSDSQNQDDGHQHPTPSGQWSTAGESQSWTVSNDSHGSWSTDSGNSHTTLSDSPEQGHQTDAEGWATDPTHGGDNHWENNGNHHDMSTESSNLDRVTTSPDNHHFGSGTTPGDGWRQDDSGIDHTSNDQDIHNSVTPEYNSEVTTTSGWTNEYPMESSDDQKSTIPHDGVSNSPPHYDDPQNDSNSPPPDYDQATLGNDYGQIPEDEPDKEGEELVAACKRESNYQGDFQDPNESSAELKCFYACALVKMDVMNEENGQMELNMQTTVNLIEDAFGENADMIEKYRNAVTACEQEVQRGGDRCEYTFNFINCGIQKVQSS